jgi:hypothetical protein
MCKSATTILAGLLTVFAASGATMSGWISDASCGAGNASSKKDARECAERCIKSGADPVFVSEGENKVYKIAGKAKVTDHLKGKVQVSGDISGDTITIKEIKPAE